MNLLFSTLDAPEPPILAPTSLFQLRNRRGLGEAAAGLLIDPLCAGLGGHGDETGGGVGLGSDAETVATTKVAELAFSLGPHACHHRTASLVRSAGGI